MFHLESLRKSQVPVVVLAVLIRNVDDIHLQKRVGGNCEVQSVLLHIRKGDCAGVNSESVDVCQRGYTVLCKCHQSYTVVSLP